MSVDSGTISSQKDIRWGALFAGLGDHYLQLLSTFSHRTVAGKGAVIFTQGRPAKSLYVIQHGKVGLEMLAPKPDGGNTRPVLLAVLGDSETFGLSALVEPYVLTLSAIAMEECNLVSIEAEALCEAVRRYLDLGYVVLSNLTKLMAQRLDQTRQALIYERGWAMVS